MFGFADETYIDVASGKGGNGCVSFRREKYVAKGGPDGGDGGKGGDVVFVVKDNLRTLANLKTVRVFRAENGEPGKGRKMHGHNGADVEIHVPPGTLLKDPDTGDLIKDLKADERWIFLRGGKGGAGNWHFRTSRRQAPRYAQPGLPGAECRLQVELQLIADIGFVGFPNAGKSSLLDCLTNAHPKIASYAFTTKIPNLGVMHGGYRDIVLADIPGIIEGASHGAGMGFKFLKHISRTAGLAFLIDLSDPDCDKAFHVLLEELKAFSMELAEKPRVVIGTKADLYEAEEGYEKLIKAVTDERIVKISAFNRQGFDDLTREFLRIAEIEDTE